MPPGGIAVSQQRLSDMAEAEFDALIEDNIERMAAGTGELPADIFLDLLLERMRAQTTTTMTLAIDEADDQPL